MRGTLDPRSAPKRQHYWVSAGPSARATFGPKSLLPWHARGAGRDCNGLSGRLLLSTAILSGCSASNARETHDPISSGRVNSPPAVSFNNADCAAYLSRRAQEWLRRHNPETCADAFASRVARVSRATLKSLSRTFKAMQRQRRWRLQSAPLRRDLDICNSFDTSKTRSGPRRRFLNLRKSFLRSQRQFRWVALISVSFLAVLQ